MADDGGFFDIDPNQPGALTGSPNLSPQDPLYDWAQKAAQVRPQDMQRFVYDPQGATQGLIDKGVQPPDHHYDSMGNPVSADDAAKLDAAKQQLGQNLTSQFGVNPPPGSGMSRAAAPQADTSTPLRSVSGSWEPSQTGGATGDFSP